mmetsp:Transcript_110967/g.309027  ORF Transcript_110967/g.309027 Transcript_110967/m.309027 type:complete len:241 (-) Transcript_110967:823-1545(-)
MKCVCTSKRSLKRNRSAGCLRMSRASAARSARGCRGRSPWKSQCTQMFQPKVQRRKPSRPGAGKDCLWHSGARCSCAVSSATVPHPARSRIAKARPSSSRKPAISRSDRRESKDPSSASPGLARPAAEGAPRPASLFTMESTTSSPMATAEAPPPSNSSVSSRSAAGGSSAAPAGPPPPSGSVPVLGASSRSTTGRASVVPSGTPPSGLEPLVGAYPPAPPHSAASASWGCAGVCSFRSQ